VSKNKGCKLDSSKAKCHRKLSHEATGTDILILCDGEVSLKKLF